MSLSRRSSEYLAPFCLRPRLAKTRNQSQFVLGMLHDSVSKGEALAFLQELFRLNQN